MSFLEKCLLRSAANFSVGLFDFLILNCMSCLFTLEMNPSSVASFANIFSQSVGCLFVLFIVSFAVQKLLSSSGSHFVCFFCVCVCCFYLHYSGRWIVKVVAVIGFSRCFFFPSYFLLFSFDNDL